MVPPPFLKGLRAVLLPGPVRILEITVTGPFVVPFFHCYLKPGQKCRVHIYNPSTQLGGVGRNRREGFKIILGYTVISLNPMRPCLKKETRDPQCGLKGSRLPHFPALFFKISLHVLLCVGISQNKGLVSKMPPWNITDSKYLKSKMPSIHWWAAFTTKI